MNDLSWVPSEGEMQGGTRLAPDVPAVCSVCKREGCRLARGWAKVILGDKQGKKIINSPQVRPVNHGFSFLLHLAWVHDSPFCSVW